MKINLIVLFFAALLSVGFIFIANAQTPLPYECYDSRMQAYYRSSKPCPGSFERTERRQNDYRRDRSQQYEQRRDNPRYEYRRDADRRYNHDDTRYEDRRDDRYNDRYNRRRNDRYDDEPYVYDQNSRVVVQDWGIETGRYGGYSRIPSGYYRIRIMDSRVRQEERGRLRNGSRPYYIQVYIPHNW